MLFVDDREPQIGELDALLEQGVGADDDARATRTHRLETGSPLRRAELAGQPADVDAERIEPGGEVQQVLLGEDLGRRHQRDLVTGLDDIGRHQRRDHRLARADVPLHEAEHRLAPRHVRPELGEHPLLRAGRNEVEARAQTPGGLARGPDRGRVTHLRAGAQEPEPEPVGDELLEGEPPVRRVQPGQQRLHVRLRRRAVHDPERLGQLGQRALRNQPPRQPVDEGTLVEEGQRLFGQPPEHALLHPVGRRVERRQRVVERPRRVVRTAHAVLGMHHLEHARPAPRFPEALQPGTALELTDLCLAEVKEAQRQRAGAVADAHEQRATATDDDVGDDDLARDDRLGTGLQRPDRRQPGAVLVAEREMEQDVLRAPDAEPFELRGHRRAHTAKGRDRYRVERLHRLVRHDRGHGGRSPELRCRAP